eukprot:CAMPEP_0195057846 /NCGR_PEP_ID=MMETSP0448-20130528/5875_1 /TAXON_ID=66468 /ORGANISM="Heterocapsa triquestra, Strain CCMP 448" /LENGTH=262 /DNA_ID=CAMNT_0040087907 /DNA_START=103 /DNA_END=891 /DNA_ORIENTATION=+
MAAFLDQGMLRLSLAELLKEQPCDKRMPLQTDATQILEGPPGLHLPRWFRPPPGLSLPPNPQQARVGQQEKVDGASNDVVLKMSGSCKPAARVTKAEFCERGSDCSTTDTQDEVLAELRTPLQTPLSTTVAMLSLEEMALSEQPLGAAGTGTVLRLGDLLPPASVPNVTRCQEVPEVGGAELSIRGLSRSSPWALQALRLRAPQQLPLRGILQVLPPMRTDESRSRKKENQRCSSAMSPAQAAALQAWSVRLQEMTRAPMFM